MLYDTHAHLNMKAFKNDWEHVAAEALAQHVIYNNVGTEKTTSQRAVDLADGKNVFAVVGLHPSHTVFEDLDEDISREEKFDYHFYSQLARDPKVVGIGECGLDYFRIPEKMALAEVKATQHAAFEQQIELAKELDKTLVIHTRATKDTIDAYEDTLKLLEKYRLNRFLVHSFTGNWDLAERFLKLGGYLGLNGIITFDKTGALKEVIEKMPTDKMVLETDSPFLAPPPHRGKRNIPQYVQYVAEYIGSINNIAVEEVAATTTANAKRLFKIFD
ncbi:MAG: YchF/TatD family exonuclease [Candidatus Doudnabacteria bacterium]|nr:YchF/TatD family exonuclease [Candidatus Doudnabacteria bacterium]